MGSKSKEKNMEYFKALIQIQMSNENKDYQFYGNGLRSGNLLEAVMLKVFFCFLRNMIYSRLINKVIGGKILPGMKCLLQRGASNPFFCEIFLLIIFLGGNFLSTICKYLVRLFYSEENEDTKRLRKLLKGRQLLNIRDKFCIKYLSRNSVLFTIHRGISSDIQVYYVDKNCNIGSFV